MGLTKVRGKGLGTLGDGTASDNSIVFDGNAQDFHIGLDDSADSLTIGLGSTLGTTSHMVIDANGIITKPLQPAFFARKSSTTNNLSVDTAHTIVFDSEVFDQGADYNNSTGIFTAPVTGRYQINVVVYMTSLPNDANYCLIELVTSNRSVQNVLRTQAGDADWRHSFVIAILMDMDASDTAKVNFYQPNGTAQANLEGTSTHAHTSFSAYLVA